MEKIVDIAQWCFHFDKEKTGMTTYGEFKLGLQTNGLSAAEIEAIYSGNNAGTEDSLEFRDFLAAALEARGRYEETILTETFERSFPEEDTSITKYDIAGLLTTVGTPERVEEFFPASAWDENKRSKYQIECAFAVFVTRH
jgi:Ca2+-binding EF-hand superfamily protein